ncbi:unnamed protein product [Ectocarpus sp. CCAP 1310/34]|nr:unnamed protein product [Ectocarpus sp. CCAP 1310/34]
MSKRSSPHGEEFSSDDENIKAATPTKKKATTTTRIDPRKAAGELNEKEPQCLTCYNGFDPPSSAEVKTWEHNMSLL